MHFASLTLLFLALLFGGCQTKESSFARIAIESEPLSLDPRLAPDSASYFLLQQLFDGLTREGPKGIGLSLAKSYTISEDGLVYTFTLNEAFWTNGEPLTAGDFVYSYTTSLRPDFAAFCATHLYLLKNARSIKEGSLPKETLGARALDVSTLELTLEYPYPAFLEMLAFPPYFPICEKIDTLNANWAQNAKTFVSCGPYAMQSWKHRESLTLARSANYWDKAPPQALPGLEFIVLEDESTEEALYHSGGLSWLGRLPQDCLESCKGRSDFLSYSLTGTQMLLFSQKSPALQNIHLRRALSSAIDREPLIQHILGLDERPATRLSNILLEGPHFDVATELEQAKQELGTLPPIEILAINSRRIKPLLQVIQQQWQQLGLEVTLNLPERQLGYAKIFEGDYDVATLAYAPPTADIEDFIKILESGQKMNPTFWVDKHFDALMLDARRTADPHLRQKALLEAEDYMLSQAPIVPLYQPKRCCLVSPHIKNVVHSKSARIDFKWATVET